MTVEIRHGLTGNYYILSEDRDSLSRVCERIGKSANSIRWVEKYQRYVVRCKSKHHKRKIKELIAP